MLVYQTKFQLVNFEFLFASLRTLSKQVGILFPDLFKILLTISAILKPLSKWITWEAGIVIIPLSPTSPTSTKIIPSFPIIYIETNQR